MMTTVAFVTNWAISYAVRPVRQSITWNVSIHPSSMFLRKTGSVAFVDRIKSAVLSTVFWMWKNRASCADRNIWVLTDTEESIISCVDECLCKWFPYMYIVFSFFYTSFHNAQIVVEKLLV